MKLLVKLVLLIFFVGLILAVVAFFGGVNLGSMSEYFYDNEAYGESIEYVSNTTIDTLDANLDNRNIVVSVTEGDQLIITYHEHEKDTWSIDESNGILTIEQTTKPIFFNWFNFKIATNEVLTVYIEIPANLVLTYSLQSDVGDITYISGPQTAHEIYTNSDTGEVRIEDVSMDSLIISLNTGTIELSNLVITGDLDAQTDTGQIAIDHLSADEIILDTDTGTIAMNHITANQVDAQSDTGRVEMSDSVISGYVDLSTSTGSVTVVDTSALGYDLSSSTGNVRFTSTSSIDLRYDLDTSIGSVSVNGDDQGSKHLTSTGVILLKIKVSTGNITVSVQD